MGRKYLAALMLAALALSGCGGKDEPAEPPVDLAAMRARRDSVAKAKVLADSIILARYRTCADSVAVEVGKTAAGRRALVRARTTPGTPVPQEVQACGAEPGATVQVVVEDTTRKAAPPPATVTPPAPQGMTPQQRQVARADSIRKAREIARADSLARATQLALADSLEKLKTDSLRADSLRQVRETEVLRETFSYSGSNRDPYISLIDLPTEGPELIDLQLVAIYQDLRYAGNSIAVVRDKKANKRYNVRVGDRIGRMKIAQIRQRDVVITIEDLGFERQETLSLRKQEEQTP